MWVFPLAAAAVALVFAGFLAKQFAARHRPYQAAWSVALLMYAVASIALFLGVLSGWTPTEFRVYWLFGAVLNVPYLFLGEVYLLVKRRMVADVVAVILVFLTAFAVANVMNAPIHADALSTDLPLGKDVFGDGTTPHRLAQYLAYPSYILLVAGCLWSAWLMRGRPELRDRFLGTVLIAVGATIVAIGSGVGAGLGVVPIFSIGLLSGITVMFWGFLRASRTTPEKAVATAPESS
jgi:hypothetical protein